MSLRPLIICNFFQCGDRLYTSESDVYRRQILTYKDGPRAERVNTVPALKGLTASWELVLAQCLLRLPDDETAFPQRQLGWVAPSSD